MIVEICLKPKDNYYKEKHTHTFFLSLHLFPTNLFFRINYVATPSFQEAGKCTLAKHTAFSDKIRKKGTIMLG